MDANFDEMMASLCGESCFMDELKAAAFEVLLLNPGIEQGDWSSNLVENYPTEVVDALGTSPEEVFAALADLWDDVYFDPATGMEKSFSDWAQTFCNEKATDLYYALVEAKKG